MADVTEVNITAGVPDSGTGGVGTIYALIPVAHDGADSGRPLKVGGFAKAAAPADVSADSDRVNAWFLRNGAMAVNLTAAGALIPGDATNGLDVDPTRLPAGEVHLGEVGGKTAVKTIAMSTDTSAYSSGDLIADTQQLDAAFRKVDGTGVLNTITIIDQDAQGVALYVLFHYTSTSLGTENSAPNISDANLAAGLQGMVAVAVADYVTVSGAKVACIRNIGLPLKSASGTDDLYISVLNSTGTPTYTATGLNLSLGILQD